MQIFVEIFTVEILLYENYCYNLGSAPALSISYITLGVRYNARLNRVLITMISYKCSVI